MKVFTAYDSNDMAPKVYAALAHSGVLRPSRNGSVLKFEGPVAMVYKRPWSRANFTAGRDANIFFHIAESMWMLAGRNDVEFLELFNRNMHEYSDDGETFNAAYGHRIRHHFGFDQLQEAAHILSKDHNSRQVIVQIWDVDDLTTTTKDKACNMSLVFSMESEQLNMVVYNRSNDLVYGGVTGANPVHFSYFHQWVADKVGVAMGHMCFISANAHVYQDLYPHWDRMDWGLRSTIPEPIYRYLPGSLKPFEELCTEIMMRGYIHKTFDNLHLDTIVKPLLNGFLYRKLRKDVDSCRKELTKLECPAIRAAAMQWVARREDGHN